ncbi:hypothetical protein LSH36_19g13016 [Paralvinella palmiformis]|uniref:Uncharacterized protein n=1 Tax=Paralvinella palmiformis TaxID=53620 RepID=A0AAD9KD32_9ANNE|nr:hypothetical protein LSH36_19g13016 [Paralvinella palmiformis]
MFCSTHTHTHTQRERERERERERATIFSRFGCSCTTDMGNRSGHFLGDLFTIIISLVLLLLFLLLLLYLIVVGLRVILFLVLTFVTICIPVIGADDVRACLTSVYSFFFGCLCSLVSMSQEMSQFASHVS